MRGLHAIPNVDQISSFYAGFDRVDGSDDCDQLVGPDWPCCGLRRRNADKREIGLRLIAEVRVLTAPSPKHPDAPHRSAVLHPRDVSDRFKWSNLADQMVLATTAPYLRRSTTVQNDVHPPVDSRCRA
jgi:hypothetical protein